MSENSDRIDKFLWSVRVFKTRSQATDACKKGQVFVNDVEAKASRALKPGDVVSVRKSGIYFRYAVLAFPPSRVGAKLVSEFVKDETSPEELKKLEIHQEPSVFVFRPRGSGRPTKKERRDIDKITDTDW